MKYREPAFYKDFQCIADRCTDTCCAGWEIEVDEEAWSHYENMEGSFGEHLREQIVQEEDGRYFRLKPGKRCPVLTENNLCKLILNKGDEVLCDICREHPRFYQWFGDYTEVGIGLCCEEGGRFLFSDSEPLRFVCSEVKEETMETEEDPLLEPLLKAREIAFKIAQNRELAVSERAYLLLRYAEILENPLQEEDPEGLEAAAAFFAETATAFAGGGSETAGILRADYEKQTINRERIRDLLAFFGGLESLDETWPTRIRTLEKELDTLVDALPAFREAYTACEWEYEHLLVYFIYRYFMEALTGCTVVPQMRFAVTALLIIQLLDVDTMRSKGKFVLWDRIENAKLFSKEMEYCPENMEAIEEEAMLSSEAFTMFFKEQLS